MLEKMLTALDKKYHPACFRYEITLNIHATSPENFFLNPRDWARSLESFVQGHNWVLNQYVEIHRRSTVSLSASFRKNRFKPLIIWDQLFMTTVSHGFTVVASLYLITSFKLKKDIDIYLWGCHKISCIFLVIAHSRQRQKAAYQVVSKSSESSVKFRQWKFRNISPMT